MPRPSRPVTPGREPSGHEHADAHSPRHGPTHASRGRPDRERLEGDDLPRDRPRRAAGPARRPPAPDRPARLPPLPRARGRMSEHPTDEQLEALRVQGWTVVTTLNGLLATHPGGPVVPW